MTHAQASQVFSKLMQQSRKRPLTIPEKRELTSARQFLRMVRKGSRRNPNNAELGKLPELRQIKASSIGSVAGSKGEMLAVFSNLDRAKYGRDRLREMGFDLSQITESVKMPGRYLMRFWIPRKNPRKLRNHYIEPNPRATGGVKIYGKLIRIEAQKTQPHLCDAACKKANHCYFHDFKPGATVYGMPDGSILIK